MSYFRDIAASLRYIPVLPGDNAAGTVSSSGFQIGGSGSGELILAIGAASGTPTSFSVTAKFMVAHDDGAGAPGTFAAYTSPDGAVAQVVLSADNTHGSVSVKLEGKDVRRWGRIDVVTAFSGGTSPKVESSAIFVAGDTEVPARPFTLAA